jgi:hypothetical protein
MGVAPQVSQRKERRRPAVRRRHRVSISSRRAMS